MKLINKIKNYFTTDEPETVALPDEAKRWKKLALEINNEVMALRRQYKVAIEECDRLEKLVKLYQELLAEKEK